MTIKLFNNLNTIQPIRVKDRSGKYYTVFIESKKVTEIEGYQLTEDIRKKIETGKLKDLNKGVKDLDEKVNSDSVEVENFSEESTSEESSNEEETSEGSVHICDVCGNEFATKRGLDLHKARSHK